MTLQAELYNQSLERLAAMVEEWRLDADKYLDKINTTKQQNKPTAAMETYHYKQIEKINTVESFAQTAATLIGQLSKELQSARERHTTQPHNYFSTEHRTRICDLPASPAELHAEQMELLDEIRADLKLLLSDKTKDNGSKG